MNNYFTTQSCFFGASSPEKLISKYGSPLYVYNESILRQRCREITDFVGYPGFRANYSAKANSNAELLKIVRSEGLGADAVSSGEIYVLMASGFLPEDIFYVANNVSEEEMRFAIERGVLMSVDSLSQLEQYGRLNPGGKIAVRFNAGVGAGHHAKVVTSGKGTKFGITPDRIDAVKALLKRYRLRLAGVNHHIGSLFMEGEPYLEGARALLDIAIQFEGLEFVDFGGGFGIPYNKQEGQPRLKLEKLGEKLSELLYAWSTIYGSKIIPKVEPGRYIAAECGVLLGSVNSIKRSNGVRYVGTDLGFNVLVRPTMYDSYHDIEVYKNGEAADTWKHDTVTIVGNVCESGDIIARDRELPHIVEGDILGITDAGAYGYSMCSNYNNRLRPAEVLIREDRSDVLIRKRDSYSDLLRNFCCI